MWESGNHHDDTRESGVELKSYRTEKPVWLDSFCLSYSWGGTGALFSIMECSSCAGTMVSWVISSPPAELSSAKAVEVSMRHRTGVTLGPVTYVGEEGICTVTAPCPTPTGPGETHPHHHEKLPPNPMHRFLHLREHRTHCTLPA